jgi:hypothetical protein
MWGTTYNPMIQNNIQIQQHSRDLEEELHETMLQTETIFGGSQSGSGKTGCVVSPFGSGGQGDCCTLPKEGSGLSIAGSGLSIAGSGLSVAGNGVGKQVDISVGDDSSPADRLKRKIMKTLMKGKGMKNNGASASRDLPDSKSYIVGTGNKKAMKMDKGGFLGITLAMLISAALAAAQTSALTAVTVGTTIATRKLLGGGADDPKLRHKIKAKIENAIKQAKITIEDLKPHARVLVKKALVKLQEFPTEKVLIEIGKTLEPVFKQLLVTVVKDKLGMSGTGLKLAGQGKLKDFIKTFVKKIKPKLKMLKKKPKTLVTEIDKGLPNIPKGVKGIINNSKVL